MLSSVNQNQILGERLNFFEGFRQTRRKEQMIERNFIEQSDYNELIQITNQEIQFETQRLQTSYNSYSYEFSIQHPLVLQGNIIRNLKTMLKDPLLLNPLFQTPVRMILLRKIDITSLPLYTKFLFLFVTSNKSFLIRFTLLELNRNGKGNGIIHSIQECQAKTLIQEEIPILIQENTGVYSDHDQKVFICIEQTRTFLFFNNGNLEGTLFLCYQENLDSKTKETFISQVLKSVFIGSEHYPFARLALPNGDLVVSALDQETKTTSPVYLPLGLVNSHTFSLPFVSVLRSLPFHYNHNSHN